MYAVEFSARSGRDLINMAQKRPNVIPIVEDARYPNKYASLPQAAANTLADTACSSAWLTSSSLMSLSLTKHVLFP